MIAQWLQAEPGRVARLTTGLVLAAVHLLAALAFFVDARLALVVLAGLVAVVVAVDRPLWGISLLIAGRITSTGANAWLRLGSINVDLFEPALLLCIGALLVHSALHKKRIWVDTPWRLPILCFLAFQVISLGWTTSLEEAIQEILATGVLLSTTLLIAAFVEDLRSLRHVLYVWIGASLFVAVASLIGIGASEDVAFEMAQNNRASGFGQHPNWFAMNLMYAVLPALALALAEKRRNWRWLFLFVTVFLFLGQARSGSRGGTYALIIGAGLTSMAHPLFRRWSLRLGILAAAAFGLIMVVGDGSTSLAYSRIVVSTGVVLGKGVRESNWLVCVQMFLDTWGRGIGGGGYAELLQYYDTWLYNSQYRYPHGIFWGLMAHYGVVGLGLAAWFLVMVASMVRDLARWTRGTSLELLVWAMPATMAGYAAWSFVEFMYDDKPFWEFLGVYTALWLVVRRIKQQGKELPELAEAT